MFVCLSSWEFELVDPQLGTPSSCATGYLSLGAAFLSGTSSSDRCVLAVRLPSSLPRV
jgi:hypothetical protein